MNKLNSHAKKKFDEWVSKIRSTLQSDNKSDLNSLPDQIRWLQHWTKKIQKREPKTYSRIVKIETELKGKAGSELSEYYSEIHLKESQRHKKGTKIRLNEILRYVYHYGSYAHHYLISGRKKEKAKTVLRLFWRIYTGEIVKNRRLLEDHQIEWLLELAKLSRTIGLKLDEDQISKLRARAVKLEVLFMFFNVKELIQMGEELSNQQTRWKFKKSPRRSLVKSIIKNATVEEIEEYIRKKIQKREIPRIQGAGEWILGPLGLLKSKVSRKFSSREDMTKFLFTHVTYPHPYLDIKETFSGKLDVKIDKNDSLIKGKMCQLILVKLNDKEILEIFNKLIDEDKVKIQTIERYWDFVVTPFGIFKPPYNGEKNLAEIILRSFQEKELRPHLEGIGTVKDLVWQKCTIEPPDIILKEFFGSGPNLTKLAKKINLMSLSKIENKEMFVKSILLRLGFNVPPDLQGIYGLSSTIHSYLKNVKNESNLAEGEWNLIYRNLERILEDLIMFYGCVIHGPKLRGLEEEERLPEMKSWFRKTFKLVKQFDYLTFGDLCALLRNMNKFSKNKRRGWGVIHRLLKRAEIVKEKHLRELDFIKSCRTQLTKIHRRHDQRRREQKEVIERLANLLRDLVSEKELSRTVPYALRLKEEVTTEFGVRYYTVVDEEENIRKLKTNELILPEEVYFIISQNDKFPINPILVKKFW